MVQLMHIIVKWAAGGETRHASGGGRQMGHKAVLLGHARDGRTRGLEMHWLPTSRAFWSSSPELELPSCSGCFSRFEAGIVLNHGSSAALIVLSCLPLLDTFGLGELGVRSGRVGCQPPLLSLAERSRVGCGSFFSIEVSFDVYHDHCVV